MKKLNRTKQNAVDIATKRISKYIYAINLIFAKRCAILSHKRIIDGDNIENYITECESTLHGEHLLQHFFSIHSDTLKRLSRIKWYDENNKCHSRVPMDEIISQLIKSNFIRLKSYQPETKTNRTLSYKPGHFSRMFILSYDEFINLASDWQNSKSYNEKFDLASDYYSDIINELLITKFKNTSNIFLDYNKYEYRKDGSNNKQREINLPMKKTIIQSKKPDNQNNWNPENGLLDINDKITVETTNHKEWLLHFYSDEQVAQYEKEYDEIISKTKIAI